MPVMNDNYGIKAYKNEIPNNALQLLQGHLPLF